jgi:hypothetical protein
MKKKIILNNQPLEIEYEKLSDLEYDLGSKHFEIVEIFGVDRDFIGPMEISSDFSIIIARAK